MKADVHEYFNFIWFTAGVIWLAGAILAKPAVRIQPSGSRALHLCSLGTSFALMFSTKLRFGPLTWRFVPESATLDYFGLTVGIAGLAFAIWGRLVLGRNWSSRVTIKQDHILVRHGPYTIVRHPIYTGILLALMGTALGFGEVRCLASLILAMVAFQLKLRVEETFLTQQFGTDYIQYQQEVKSLIPFIL